MNLLTRAIARRHMLETTLETSVPGFASVIGWLIVMRELSYPQSGKPLTDLEVVLALGLAVALSGWAVGRVGFILGMRYPLKMVLLSMTLHVGLLGVLGDASSELFRIVCRENDGRLASVRPLEPIPRSWTIRDSNHLIKVCRQNTQEPGPFTPGVLLRPAWQGNAQLLPWGLPLLLLLAMFSTLGLRDRKLMRSGMPRVIWEFLRLAAAGGSATAWRNPDSPAPLGGPWLACNNATLWGEPCGQLYVASHSFARGEPCVRCGLLFRPAPTLTLAVIALRYGDIDFLNGLESREARIWRQTEPQPAQPLTSEPRWVTLLEVQLPDVVSVSQAIAMTLETLRSRQVTGQGAARALELVFRQASRVTAWAWFSSNAPDLSSGIPVRDLELLIGAQRLRDVYGHRSGWKGFQLDIGLLPVDLRLGLWKPPEALAGEQLRSDAGVRYNNRQVFWLPVSRAAVSEEGQTLWVPRVEGEGLRTWLTLTSRQAHLRPAPYFWPECPWKDEVQLDVPHDLETWPLSLVRLPAPEARALERADALGCRLGEWDWLDRPHLALLRSQTVMMAPADFSIPEAPDSDSSAANPTDRARPKAAATSPEEEAINAELGGVL